MIEINGAAPGSPYFLLFSFILLSGSKSRAHNGLSTMHIGANFKLKY